MVGMFGRVLREAGRTMLRRHQHAAIRRNMRHAPGDGLVPVAAVADDIERYEIEGPGGPHRIHVMLPPAPVPPGGYPVLYLLDGDAWIGTAADALRVQARFPAHSGVGAIALVAIGYPGREPVNLGRRARDFLPPHTSPRLADRFMQGAPWHQPGGADAFLEFLIGPLAAALARRYPLDMTRRALCGQSFGGHFALHAFLSRPDAFHRIAAVSPSLWWDAESLVRSAPERVAALAPETSADLFIAVAEHEMPGNGDICRKMVEHSRDFAALARARGLNADWRLLAGENHQSAMTAAISAVLRFAAPLEAGV